MLAEGVFVFSLAARAVAEGLLLFLSGACGGVLVQIEAGVLIVRPVPSCVWGATFGAPHPVAIHSYLVYSPLRRYAALP